MIEAIILSMLSFVVGWLVGAAITSKNDTVREVLLDNGKSIHMWKGFVDPNCIFVAVEGSDGELNGDSVVFNKEGDIIFINKHVE